MAESLISFFELVVSIIKEFRLKVCRNSELAVLEGMHYAPIFQFSLTRSCFFHWKIGV